MKAMFTSKKWLLFAAAGVFIIMQIAFTFQQGNDWPVPDEYLKKKNPVKADKESLNIGKSLYAKHCQSCHGKYGEGDGSKAGELKDHPGDFTEEKFQKQPDGALFYKTMTGKDEMPEFRKKIPDDEDLWHLVNYLRTFCK